VTDWLTATSATHSSLITVVTRRSIFVIELSRQHSRGRQIFGWILTRKLRGSAYRRVMPHSHALTARVSMAYSCCGGCIPVRSATVTWHHSNTHTVQGHRSCHVHATCSRRCEVTGTHYQRTDLGYSFVTDLGYLFVTDLGYSFVTDLGYLFVTDLGYSFVTDLGYSFVTDFRYLLIHCH